MLHPILKYRIHIFLFIFLMCLMAFYPHTSLHITLISIAFSSLGAFIYIYNKATDIAEDSINLAALGIHEDKYLLIKRVSIGLLLFGFILCLPYYKLAILYIVLAIVGYFYSVPLPFLHEKKRLKNILGIKNISAAMCWATLPVMLPILYYGREILPYDIFMWLNYFFFIMAVEIVWDIRDIDGDKIAEIRTIPNTYGVLTSKIICVIPLIILFLWRLLTVSMHPIFFFAYLATIVAVIVIRKNSHPYAFHALVLIWIGAYASFLLKGLLV